MNSHPRNTKKHEKLNKTQDLIRDSCKIGTRKFIRIKKNDFIITSDRVGLDMEHGALQAKY